MTTERGRFPWVLTVVCAAALALLIGLGTWQVRRLAWKESLIARSELAATRPAVALPAPSVALEPFQRVVLDCDFNDAAHRLAELQTIHEGTPGVRLLSACGGRIVDLGFVAETVSARPAQTAFPAPRPSGAYPTIEAVVREAPRPGPFAPPPRNGRFFSRDNAAIAAMLGVPARNAGQTLYATQSAFPGFGALRPSAPPAAFANNHLGYALTWFGLAIALIGFYVALLRRRSGRPTS